MSEKEKVIWGMHAGSKGEANDLFLKKKLLGIGWHEMGDMSDLPKDWGKIKERVSVVFKDKMNKQSVSVNAGILRRFINEMKPGDIVVYPSKLEKTIHIGEIVGEYEYNPKINSMFPNQRKVKWLEHVPRKAFKQGALYEIGSLLTTFQIKNYASEIYSILEHENIESDPDTDDTISYVAADVEQTTIDYVLKQLSKKLHGHALEGFVASLLEAMGYRATVTQASMDGGVDVIAHKDELGIHPPIIKVQVKSSEGSVGSPAVSQLYGVVDNSEVGLFITLGSYSKQAKAFEKNKSNLRLVDGDELVKLLLDHYQDLSPRYKALIPLKQIYVPDPAQEEE
ncbi:MAG: restriction endonuclease [Desulfarculus sp.]|nr:restriction endonuclease [Pseudomonadota bacterium]MBV1716203.1 restriction endonuclease [Desulfarculus sp.]MBU4574228.1 restriction endonuclease [Pseudomonadota bacterium]MBU4599785.1 restriction endonuclease [Pseudomonadota bacterium]MBV1738142.1 restriction endonuclease [Desulfarculus sp.]